MKKFLFLILTIFFFLTSNAEYVEYTSKTDKSKLEQVKSLEAVYWNFHPGWYYVSFHNGYCGGNGNLLNPKFKESKGDGWVSKRRAEELIEETATKKWLEQQIDSIQPLVEEERARFAERSVDLEYLNYSSDLKSNFEQMENVFKKISVYSSHGTLALKLANLYDEKELLEEEMEYIHKNALDGEGNEMEQTKRALAYEELLNKQKSLITRGSKLYLYALANYCKEK